MSTMLPVVSAMLYPASATCLDFKCPLKITHLSDSWGLPESSQMHVLIWTGTVFAYLSCFLSQFLLYFCLFDFVLGFPLLPLSFCPLPFFLLSLFFHFRKLPFHTTCRFHRAQHKPSDHPSFQPFTCHPVSYLWFWEHRTFPPLPASPLPPHHWKQAVLLSAGIR